MFDNHNIVGLDQSILRMSLGPKIGLVLSVNIMELVFILNYVQDL